MTGICLINEKMYLDERVQKIILGNFQGIAFAGFQEGFGFYSKHKDKLKKSLSLNGSVMDEQLRCYIDEPMSNPTMDNKYFAANVEFTNRPMVTSESNDPVVILRERVQAVLNEGLRGVS